MNAAVVDLVRRLFSIADQPGDTSEDQLRHRFLIATGLAMSCGGLLWGTMGLMVGTPWPAIIPYGYTVATVINFALLAKTKRFGAARTFQIAMSLALPFFFQWSLGGFHPSGAVMLWALLSLVASLSFEEARASIRWWILFLALTIFSGFIDKHLTVPATVDEASLGRTFITMNMCTVVSAVFFLTLYLVSARGKAIADLGERNDQLAQSQAALVQSERMAALGQLVAGVAHELNTPLGAIRASVSNLGAAVRHAVFELPELLAGLPPERRRAFMALIAQGGAQSAPMTSREQRQARRALRVELEAAGVSKASMVADTLVDMGVLSLGAHGALLAGESADALVSSAYNLSALQRNSSNIDLAAERAAKIVFALKSYAHPGAADAESTSADLTGSLDTVLTLYHSLIKRGIEVVREYDEAGTVTGRHESLNQVWTNLIHNALQAMGEAGTLHVRVAGDAEAVEVCIADSGGGIPADVLPRIFEPFYTTKASGEGTGLGLSICRDIVSAHGGTIDVAVKEGGTEFTVRLPRAPGEAA